MEKKFVNYMKYIKRLFIIIFIILSIFLLSSCEEEITREMVYANVSYYGRSTNGYISDFRKTDIKTYGYVIDESHPYDVVKNKNGCDVIIHCVKYKENGDYYVES